MSESEYECEICGDGFDNPRSYAGHKSAHSKRIPEADLIEELERLRENYGRPPKQREMDQDGEYASRTYALRFGSWTGALEAAGMDPSKTREPLYSDDELLQAIHDLKDELGHRPTSREMENYGKHSSLTYRDRFGSWNEALEAAGYDTSVRIERETLIRKLQELASELGRRPTGDDMKEHGPYSASVYRTRFSTFLQAVKEAGLLNCYPTYETYHDGIIRVRLGLVLDDVEAKSVAAIHKPPTKKIDSETLLAELTRVAEKLEYTPRRREFDEYAKFNSGTLANRFGSWDAAAEAAGLEPRNNTIHNSQTLIEELQRLADDFGRVPTVDDVRQHTEHGVGTYQSRFGSWASALREAGFEPNRKPRVEVTCSECGAEIIRSVDVVETFDHFFCSESCKGAWQSREYTGEGNPRWQGGYDNYYGPNWPEQRRCALERDRWICQSCGAENAEHEEKYDATLHVHHIKPIRTFDEPSQANKLSNLVTLCQQCHKRWEGIPLRPQFVK